MSDPLRKSLSDTEPSADLYGCAFGPPSFTAPSFTPPAFEALSFDGEDAGVLDAPIHVGLDARMLSVRAGTGVATYARVLARCLAHAGAAPIILGERTPEGAARRSGVSLWLSALDPRSRPAMARAHAGTAGDDTLGGPHKAAGDVSRVAQSYFNLHGRLMPVSCARPPEIMHWTYPVPLYVEGARNIYTVHDLIPFSHPEVTSISQTRHKRLLRRIRDRADGIVTVSETVRQAVIAHLGCDDDFVVNTYQAALAPLRQDPPLPAGLTAGDYFFFCGTVEPRKNLLALAEAHARSGVSQPLVIVGPSAPGHHALELRLRAIPGVIRLNWQPRVVLLGLMRRARALLFPSIAEGFGLPIAEAMTLGVPVMTSDHGAQAEVAGGAARLVDPDNITAMALAISALAQDDDLCARLRVAGFDRARMFSPQAYGERLRALYEGHLSRPRPLAAMALD
jgi:glycosyltransferase involved in cell wall biosynthesis